MRPSPDIILTGIPRSGTTLAAALLDGLANAVCLNEPGWHTAKSAPDAKGFADYIASEFTRLRSDLLAGNPVPDRRQADGAAATNYYRRGSSGGMEEQFHIFPFTRSGLTPDFLLAVKHNGPYLAVLPELLALERFRVIAVIREPVAVIHSWRSLSLPISQARLPNAAPFWPELAAICASGEDLLQKQVRIYGLMCRRLWQLRERITLLRYEALVENPALIAEAAGRPVPGGWPSIQASVRAVPEEERRRISAMLKSHAPETEHFYPEIAA